MAVSLVKLPEIGMTLYGIQHGVMIPLVSLRVDNAEDIDKLYEDTLSILADNSVCILHDTLVYTDKFDAFTIKVNKSVERMQ